MENVQIPRTLVNQLMHHAQMEPEKEVCGLIAEKDGTPQATYAVTNRARDPYRLFDMDPKELIESIRVMREQGQKLFAIYHSHPHAPALPSERDIRENGYPDVLHLIVSLNTKGVLEIRGFQIDDKHTVQERPLAMV